MKEMTPDEVREVQLNILSCFAGFCQENGLYYTLYYGTLIGAVRHKGFIPWDDDIDVAMPRPDYEKFIELSKRKKVAVNMEVLQYRLGNSTYPFIKVIDTGTVLEEKFVKNVQIGVWIDIFPVDGNFKSNLLNALHYRLTRVFIKMIEIHRNDLGSGTTNVKRAANTILYPIAKVLPCIFLCRILDKIGRLKDFKKSDLVGNLVWTYSFHNRIHKEDFLKGILVEFEGRQFNILSNYDEFLSAVYGDYMTLPPENKRIRHDFHAWWKESGDI